jgi:tetratricopeptide (TPR) repeat protein
MTAAARRWRGVAVLSCALGMACKESMVTAPVVVALFDRVFLFESFREAWQTRRGLYVGLAMTWLVLAVLLGTNPRPHSAGFSAGLEPWTYLLNQPPVIVRYLQQAAWPTSLVLLYGPPRDAAFADVWPYAAVIVGLLVLTVVAARRRPQLAFLGAWFWVTLAPTSTIVPIATEVAAERRMYLPLAALVVLAVVGMVWLSEMVRERLARSAVNARVIPFTAVLLFITVSAALASATVARNQEYASPVVMARTILERHPTPTAHLSLGRALLDAGEREEGLKHVRLAVPAAPQARWTLGLQLLRDGKTDEGIAQLRAFVHNRRPYLEDVIIARMAIGAALLKQDRWADAAEEFRIALKTLPGNSVAAHYLADAAFALGHWDEAIAQYRSYLRHEPRDAGALNNLGIALGSSGRTGEAREAFRRATDADPDFGPAHRNLAQVLLADRDLHNALVHARRAVALQPDDAGSRELQQRILLWLAR